MAQKRKKSNKKWIFWVLMIVLFVVAAVVCYLVWDGYFKNKEDKPVEEQVLMEENKEEDSSEDEMIVEKEKVVQYEGEDPNEKEGLTGAVTYAGVSGDNLMIRVNIDQYVVDGECKLSLWRDGALAYDDAAAITTAAATATCEGFNVSLDGLSGGNYKIVIKISSGDKAGTINGEVNI